MKSQKIQLFFWSEKKFLFKDKENYGDLLSKYLVEKISKKEVEWVNPKRQKWYKRDKTHFLGIGSIIHHASKNSIVWGSGIIDKKLPISKADFRAVRGPQTREVLLSQGYNCPELFGDPALLLPKYYNPKIKKRYKLGIIPHYNDFQSTFELYKNEDEILVIDLMTMDVEAVTDKILQCEKTISSSLHGSIVSHAYFIPSILVKFSNKIFGDGVKYRDYLESVAIIFYEPTFLKEKLSLHNLNVLFDNNSLPSKMKIEEIQEELLNSCPFKS